MKIRSRIELFLLSLSCLLATSSGLWASLDQYTIKNATTRNALCNDGTPGVFYFERGTGDGQNRWVIFLIGGGFCKSNADCDQREITDPGLMTSNGLPTSVSTTGGTWGIMSITKSSNPDFSTANHVAIYYCSSDLWTGTRKASDATHNRYFLGSKIFRAVIADLKDETVIPSPNLRNATEVLLSGSSAGGAGVIVNLDWLAAKLPSAKVRGLDDAGWSPDIAPFDSSKESFATLFSEAAVYWRGKVDTSCIRANLAHKSRCYLTDVYRYIKTPVLIQTSQRDPVILEDYLGVTFPLDSAEKTYVDQFASETRKSLANVTAAFSPKTMTHAILVSSKFNKLRIDGHSLREVVGNFFFDRSGPVKLIQ